MGGRIVTESGREGEAGQEQRGICRGEGGEQLRAAEVMGGTSAPQLTWGAMP